MVVTDRFHCNIDIIIDSFVVIVSVNIITMIFIHLIICPFLHLLFGLFSYALIDGLVQERRNSLQWRHNEHDGVSNHRRLHCLLKRLFRHRSKETSKLRVTGLCVGNSPATGDKGLVTRKMFPFDDVITSIDNALGWRPSCTSPSIWLVVGIVVLTKW